MATDLAAAGLPGTIVHDEVVPARAVETVAVVRLDSEKSDAQGGASKR